MTMAALRPGPPVTEPPGCVVPPVWYSPGIGIRCCAHPGAGRSAPLLASERSPPWKVPCHMCGLERSKSTGETINIAASKAAKFSAASALKKRLNP